MAANASAPLEARENRPGRRHAGIGWAALGALGVVYGDIGTSPLYALKECFAGTYRVPVDEANVLGVLSLVFWALTLVIVFKYLAFIMAADNQGEGGILALLALVKPDAATPVSHRRTTLILLGLFGAALLYGDGMITPSISVLSALEGLDVATTALHPFVLPLTVGVLLGLFMVQKRGTAGIGAVFGPTMLAWFVTIAALGVPWIVRHPGVLAAVNPMHAARFFVRYKIHGFLVLGGVVLCITGGEALYADMGHFGKRPIRLAWYVVVFPALLLNYFGQGALLLHHGAAAAANPFYQLVGTSWLLYPVVAIGAVAAVVASQALISGAFSLTQQAVQLGFSPRVTIVHTSGDEWGQIYVPEINTLLMVACVALVLGFKDSNSLAAAYGIAVTGTMSITSLLYYAVTRDRWKWSRPRAGALVAVFLVFDLAFFGANLAKIEHGAWFPLAVAAVIYLIMTTWNRGRQALRVYTQSATYPLEDFLADVQRMKPTRVPGAAVFMTQDAAGTPAVLLHHFKHNKVLHARVILLSVTGERVPEVPESARVEVIEKGNGFFRVVARYGFMQTPNVPEIMRCCKAKGLATELGDTSFYLGRETLLLTGHSGMSRWRKALFAFMSRNARTATAYFGLPPNRVVELGTQIEL